MSFYSYASCVSPKTEWLIHDFPKPILGISKFSISNKFLDISAIVLGGLSCIGNGLSSFSSNSEIVFTMFSIDILNWMVSAGTSIYYRKKYLAEEWKKNVADFNRKWSACTIAIHLILRTTAFGLEANEFSTIDSDKERSKIMGYASGISHALGIFIAACSTCYSVSGDKDATTKGQVNLDGISLLFSASSAVLGYIDASIYV